MKIEELVQFINFKLTQGKSMQEIIGIVESSSGLKIYSSKAGYDVIHVSIRGITYTLKAGRLSGSYEIE